jgi:hypothetical protein
MYESNFFRFTVDEKFEVDEKWSSESKTRINYLMMVREKIDLEKMKRQTQKLKAL